ncbi:hypothetical protein [Streptomyces sp. NPDC085529]|uniref:hypothetical protein n=1 Tax=Streptomyces sp. NPDC085529 TaxID=3365729 RepID=UPI0037D36C8C
MKDRTVDRRTGPRGRTEIQLGTMLNWPGRPSSQGAPNRRRQQSCTAFFAEMLTALAGARLPEWITGAIRAGPPGITIFAVGRESDFDAVTAGLTSHCDPGPVEGAVNRIKMLERQMFCRAGFKPLRKRVLIA